MASCLKMLSIMHIFFSKKYLSYTEQTSVSTSIKDEALEKNCREGENVG